MLTRFECLLILVKPDTLIVSKGGITIYHNLPSEFYISLYLIEYVFIFFQMELFHDILSRNDRPLLLAIGCFQFFICYQINYFINMYGTDGDWDPTRILTLWNDQHQNI